MRLAPVQWMRDAASFRRSTHAGRRFALGLLAVAAASVVALALTPRLWGPWLGRSLECDTQVSASDAILIENFDPDYLLFERAEAIERAGLARRVLVHGEVSRQPGVPNPVSLGFVEVMARAAHLRHVTYIPVREQEPIEFGVARQVRSFLVKNGITSVILLSPGFRSRRSLLVYQFVLGEAGVRLHCVPVFSQTERPENWTRSWHGRQDVLLQFAKLQYYRFYVLPFYSSALLGPPVETGHEIWLDQASGLDRLIDPAE